VIFNKPVPGISGCTTMMKEGNNVRIIITNRGTQRYHDFKIEEKDLGIPLINSLPFIPSHIGCLKCSNLFPIDFITVKLKNGRESNRSNEKKIGRL